MRDARASRYRAIVMNGDLDQEMKIAAVDTDTTARAIPRYGETRTGDRTFGVLCNPSDVRDGDSDSDRQSA